MIRRAWLAAVLTLAACYPPPVEPEPARIVVAPLLPTPLLESATAACTGERIASDAAAAARRLGSTARKIEGAYGGYSRYRYWWSQDYQASYDAAQAAVRVSDARLAATRAAARVSAHEQSAADYADLSLAHAAAFSAADRDKDRARRSAEGALRDMAHGQPDLEALYQQEFERRYGNESCSFSGPRVQPRVSPTRTPGVPLTGPVLPLLPSPLLNGSRASCAADIVSQRSASAFRQAWARQVGSDSAAAAPVTAEPGALTDWRAARALADLAALHAGVFALDAAAGEESTRGKLESRIRKIARETPGLEKAYQEAFAPAYSGPACVGR